MSDLIKLVKAHEIEPLKQAVDQTENFDISEFFNENFMFWNVDDVDFLGKHFDISADIQDNSCYMKPDVLNYFLEKGLQFDSEAVESMLTFDDGKRLAVLLAHKVPLDSGIIFNWPIFDKEDLLKIYLENGGNPNLRDEDGTSLIDAWYSQKGSCPAVALLEKYGAVKSPDAMTRKEKLALIADFGEKMKDPEFAKKFEAADARLAGKGEK